MKLLKRLLIVAALVLVARTPHADARPHLLRRACQPAPAPQPTGQYALAAPPVVLHPTAVPPCLFRATDRLQRIPAPQVPVPALPPVAAGLQGHANAMAASGRLSHSGAYLPGATREGVGFSTVSPDDAIRHCCFHGQFPTVGVTVARGANGWYAVQQYGDGPQRPLAQPVGQVAYSLASVPGAAVQGVGQFFAGPRTCGPNGCR